MLRSFFVSMTMIALAALAAGCGSDGGVSVVADWQVRCPQSGAGVCAGGGPARMVDAVAGDSGVDLECRTTQTASGNTILNFSVELLTDAGDPAALQFNDLNFAEGGSPTSGRIRFEEGGVAFEGGVSADEPCEVMSFGPMETSDGRAFIAQFICRDITDPRQAQRVRDVTGTDGLDAPVTVTIDGCSGLL